MSDVRRQTTQQGSESPTLLTIDLEARTPPVLHVDGELDMASADQLSAALQEALADNPTVVLDLAGVTFVDLIGLRAILDVTESLNGQKPVPVVNAARVAKLLRLVYPGGVPSIVIQEEA